MTLRRTILEGWLTWNSRNERSGTDTDGAIAAGTDGDAVRAEAQNVLSGSGRNLADASGDVSLKRGAEWEVDRIGSWLKEGYRHRSSPIAGRQAKPRRASVTSRVWKIDRIVALLRRWGRTVRDALGWNTAATVLKYVSLVAVVIAISTVVLVVSKVAPPIQLITVPLAVANLLQSQLALANARRHERRGDPSPGTWAEIFGIT